VLLSTCNRVEVYAWYERRQAAMSRTLARALARATSMPWVDLEPYATQLHGQAALRHLVRVAAGLDSLIVGEEQIRGQVRDAVQRAEDAHALPALLRGVFQRAAESARRVRGGTRLGNVPSIAVAAVHVAAHALPDGLAGQPVVVLGAGVMARAATDALVASGAQVTVLNRTPARAQAMVAHLASAVTVGGLDELPSALLQTALVVGATASHRPVLDLATAQAAVEARAGRALLMLDIAVPRDIDPRVRELAGVRLIDLDDLERECPIDTAVRSSEIAHAEQLAADEADRLAEWLRFRSASPAIAELRNFAETIRVRELQRSSARLRDLTPDQIAAVEALTAGIVNKLLHGPTVALRDASTRTRVLNVLRPKQGRTA
jgi:glutamyl-tRNA reductase